jgi:hypothetical protein
VPRIRLGNKTIRYTNPGASKRMLNMMKILRLVKTGEESNNEILVNDLFFITLVQ